MAEQEELRLTVTVDDRATAQLQGLRGQLSSMGGGAQAAGLERLRRQTGEVGQGVGSLSEAMRGMATRAGVIGGVVGALAGKLMELGTQFVQRATDIKAYSEAILTLQKNAQLAGTTAAQFQANMNTIRESTGISAEEAASQLTKFGEAWVDLQRQNSQTRQSLTQGLRGQDLANMQNFLTQAMQSDVNTAFNLAQDYAKKIKQYWIEQGQPARGEQVSRDFLARFGLQPTEARLAPVTPEDDARAKAREAGAKAYRDEVEKTATAWNRIATSASAILVDSGVLGTSSNVIRGNMEAAATAAEKLEDNIRKAQAAADKAAPQPGATGGPGDEWWRRFDPTDPRNIARENAAREAAGQPPLQPGAVQPDQRRQSAEDRLREFNKRARERQEQEERDRAPPPTRTGPTRPSAPVERPPGMAPTRIPIRPRVLIAPPPDEAPPPDAAAIEAAAAAEVAAKAEADRLEARRQAELLRRRGGRPSIFDQPPPPPPPPPATVPQQFTGGQVSTTMPLPIGGFVPDPNFLAGREAGLGTAGGEIEDRRALEDQTGALTEEMRRLNETLRATGDRGQPPAPPAPGPTMADALGIGAIGTPPAAPSIVVPPPQPPAPIVVPFGDRFGEWPQPQQAPPWSPPDRGSELAPQQEGRAPPPSAFEGGKMSLMGGAAMDQGQAAQAFDAKALDRAAARDVNVNGTGKISVDVRAPAGTNVKAQGQGLFKRTEITRQTQMMPASYGPDAATGIGAAEGEVAAKDIHNPWRDDLLPASYDGHEFFVDVGSRESGNRLVVHSFPKKDQPYTENMGRRPIEFRVRGYVIQSSRRPDYRPARDALQARLEQGMAGKAGQLQLPTMRPVSMIIQNYRLTEEERLGGYCVFDMHFVEAGTSPFKPTASPQQQLTQKADALGSRNQAVIGHQ